MGRGFWVRAPHGSHGFCHLVGGLLRTETSADVPQHLLTVATLTFDRHHYEVEPAPSAYSLRGIIMRLLRKWESYTIYLLYLNECL